MEEVAGLNFVQGDDHILEENDVFISQRHCETRNDTSEDVKQLGSSIEFESLVDERIEAVIDSLTYHFAARHQLGIQPMQNVLQILPLSRLL